MKVIIAGLRTFQNYEIVEKAINESGFEINEVVCGCALGVDSLGECWGIKNDIPISRFTAEWRIFGKGAGPIRNQQMAEYGDTLIAIWDGESRGTGDMVRRMKKMNKDVYIKYV